MGSKLSVIMNVQCCKYDDPEYKYNLRVFVVQYFPGPYYNVYIWVTQWYILLLLFLYLTCSENFKKRKSVNII
jgi:hypothetical protein